MPADSQKTEAVVLAGPELCQGQHQQDSCVEGLTPVASRNTLRPPVPKGQLVLHVAWITVELEGWQPRQAIAAGGGWCTGRLRGTSQAGMRQRDMQRAGARIRASATGQSPSGTPTPSAVPREGLEARDRELLHQ